MLTLLLLMEGRFKDFIEVEFFLVCLKVIVFFFRDLFEFMEENLLEWKLVKLSLFFFEGVLFFSFLIFSLDFFRESCLKILYLVDVIVEFCLFFIVLFELLVRGIGLVFFLRVLYLLFVFCLYEIELLLKVIKFVKLFCFLIDIGLEYFLKRLNFLKLLVKFEVLVDVSIVVVVVDFVGCGCVEIDLDVLNVGEKDNGFLLL